MPDHAKDSPSLSSAPRLTPVPPTTLSGPYALELVQNITI